MIAVNFSEFRNNMKKYLDTVEEDEDTLIVTRSKGRGAVVISLSEYNSWKETEYLLSTKANAEHLRKSMQDIEDGKFVEFELPDDV